MTSNVISVVEYPPSVELLEVDEKIVSVDGVDHFLLVLYHKKTKRTFVRWTRVDRDVLGDLIEVDPGKVADILAHPTIYCPADVRAVISR
jgi:hypothetical protein